MNGHTLVILTITELQALHRSGMVSLDSLRLVWAPPEWLAEEAARLHVASALVQKLPAFDPEEDHSAVVAEFDGDGCHPGSRNGDWRIAFAGESCLRIFPLTLHAAPIVTSRLGDWRVQLDPPHLSDAFDRALDLRQESNSRRGASALVGLVAKGSFNHTDHLQALLNNPVISKVLAYTRHKPWDDVPVSAVLDLGVILRPLGGEEGERKKALDQLADACRDKVGTSLSLQTVLGNEDIAKALEQVRLAWELPVDARSLALLLLWLYRGQKAQGVDIGAVTEDCREIAEVLWSEGTVPALWLLGFRAGFESFHADWYARQDKPNALARKSVPHLSVRLQPRPPVVPITTREPADTVAENSPDTPLPPAPPITYALPKKTKKGKKKTKDAKEAELKLGDPPASS